MASSIGRQHEALQMGTYMRITDGTEADLYLGRSKRIFV